MVKKAGKRLEKYRCKLYISSFWRRIFVKKPTETICVPDSTYQSNKGAWRCFWAYIYGKTQR